MKKDDFYSRFGYVTYDDLHVLNRRYPHKLGEIYSDDDFDEDEEAEDRRESELLDEDDGRHPDEKNSVLLAIRAPPQTEIKAGGSIANPQGVEGTMNQDEY